MADRVLGGLSIPQLTRTSREKEEEGEGEGGEGEGRRKGEGGGGGRGLPEEKRKKCFVVPGLLKFFSRILENVLSEWGLLCKEDLIKY